MSLGLAFLLREAKGKRAGNAPPGIIWFSRGTCDRKGPVLLAQGPRILGAEWDAGGGIARLRGAAGYFRPGMFVRAASALRNGTGMEAPH